MGFDSMDLAVLTARIDEEYGVDIFESGIIDTVKEIKQKLGWLECSGLMKEDAYTRALKTF